MTAALMMACRVQAALDELAGLKRRSDDEEAEEALTAALAGALAPVLDSVSAYGASRGVPADTAQGKEALGDLHSVEESLFDALTEHVGGAALGAIAYVEQAVAQARKALPDALRPTGMDRRLFATLTRVGSRMLRRFSGRALDALVLSADVGIPPGQLRETLGDMLNAELRRLSRHAIGDAKAEATVLAERDLGVERHRWMTADDGEVRPAHAAVHGEVVALGERFSNGWRRPGGVGCRCWLEPVVD